MNSFIILALFFHILILQFTQISTVDLTTYQCGDVVELEKGDDAIICVHVNDQKLSFRVEVDKYSALQLSGAYAKYKSSDKPTLYIQTGDQITSEGVLYGGETVVSVYSVVITLEDGIVKGVVWDNGCFGACDSNCVENIGCSASCVGDGFECDPKIYVSWIGTDTKGLHMTSSGMRISVFASYSIKKLYDSAKGKIQNIDITV